MGEYNINGLGIPMFLVFMTLEYLFLRLKGRTLHRYSDTVTSLSMGLCLLISDALLKTYTFAVFIYLSDNHKIFEFGALEPTTWIFFFLALDLCYYWFHRMAHEINLLWGAHVGHHQSEEYNFTTALRQSAFQYGFSWVFYLPLAILGCPPEVFLVLFVLLKMYQFGLHTQSIQKIPFIEGVFSTPSSHRVHHAKNPIYIDRNYGGTLVIWDRFFSTWQPELESEPCHYGTTQPLNTLNPIKANFQHWAILAQDSLHTRLWRNKVGLWFKPTGWRPEDCIDQSSKSVPMQKTGCAPREKYDPQVSKWTRWYSGFSFLCITAIAVMFIFLAPSLSGSMQLMGAAIIVYSLVVVNDLLEGHKRLAWLEVVRLPVIIWLASTLWFSTSTTRIVDTIIMDKPATQVITYASTPDLWSQWHTKSSTVYAHSQNSLGKGDKFEEDIETALGQNHLAWSVVQSTDEQWVAHANNITNGATIKLQYRVRDLGDQTEFERTLDYTLPNIALVALNAIFYKSQVEKNSEQALLRLKAVIENRTPAA